MLTVDFHRLGLRAGERLLDVGAGAGRHAFEGMRRGALVVAFDADAASLKDTAAMMAEVDGEGSCVHGDALALPFPDAAFDRVVAAEVLEHVADDRGALREVVRVLRPGGTLAVTVPRWFPELVCWALDSGYHAPEQPGGHVRIYRRGALVQRLRNTGVHVTGSHHAHSLHSPYWWLKCAVGVGNDDHRLVRAYKRFLEWDIIERPLVTRVADRALNPVLGKSLVVYAVKPHAGAGGQAVAPC